tara:strand:+ start:3042 stop:3923 length:882 start_codon:yes stop_codon:yes gene_type:complete
MVLAGMSSAGSIVEPQLYWVREFDWFAVPMFLSITLLAGSIFASKFQKSMVSDKKENDSASGGISAGNGNIRFLVMGGLILILLESVLLFSLSQRWDVLLIPVWVGILFYLFRVNNEIHQSSTLMKLLVGACIGFLSFLCGWNYVGLQNFHLARSIPYVAFFVAVFGIRSLTDSFNITSEKSESDQHSENSRMPAFIGSILLTIGTVIGIQLNDPIISTSSIVSLPFFISPLIFPKKDHFARASIYPVLILAIFIGVRYPWYFAGLFVLFHVTRIYSYFRLNTVYPTFHVGYD